MTTFFYRFDSEQAYIDACPVEFSEVEAVIVPPPNVDVLGTITKIVGDEPVVLNGFHVNTPQAVEGWEAYQVNPVNPQRIFWSAE